MSTDRDTTRIVRSWLEEGVTTLPDRVLDIVLDQVPATPQRRSWWPSRRFANMNPYARAAAAAAAVLVVAVVGYQLLPSNAGPGTPTAPPSPTPAPTATPLPASGPIAPGTYGMGNRPTILVTVPAGWESVDGKSIRKHVGQPNEVTAFDLFSADIQVFADACQSDLTEVPVGPLTSDLLTALRAQENSDISDPVDLTVAGVPGKRVVMSAPAGLVIAQCSIGSLQILRDATRWLAGVGTGGDFATVYVADTPRGRLLIALPKHDGTSADVTEAEAIFASIRLQP